MIDGLEVKSSPLLDDQPSDIDRLGFDSYAGALADVILNPQTNTPFFIGIFGRWGTGKTTLMRFLERRLADRKAISIWFSAWVYGEETEIGAAFLQSVTSQLSSRLRLADKLSFSVGLLTRGLAWERLPLQLPAVLIQVVLVLAPAVLGLLAAQLVGVAQTLGVVLGTMGAGATLLAGWYQLRPLFARLGKSDMPGLSLYRAMDFEKHIGVLENFREQFRRMVASLPESAARVIIFIDDLDRCEPDKALRLLDVIKIFLDAPRCVFVLGLDLGVVQKALERKYPGDETAQREYLSKIIQLPFHLPPPTKDDLKTYLEKLDVRFPDRRCGEVFLGSVAHNPREIKRLINTYSVNWYLAQARAGNAVTPVRLAKIIVIQQAYGPLFALLRERPDWLALLEQALRGPSDATASTEADYPSQATVIIGPTGIALPPAILPFSQDPGLQSLLTLHPQLSRAEDDANFGGLSGDEIAVYFTFAGHGLTTVAGDVELSRAGAPEPAAFPDFGTRYRVLSRLGTGGIGEVFLAQDLNLGRQVAIKRLHATLMADDIWTDRFSREIKLLRQVTDHPNIVRILDSGVSSDVDGATPFYVMDNGGVATLAKLLEQGPLPRDKLRRILLPLFGALEHVHRAGIIHGDVKPSSIVIDLAGVPKLVDFGLAFLSEHGRDNLTQTGTVLATVSYASPEQIRGSAIDVRSDLFSFGAVIYESLTGQRPFAGSASEAATKILGGFFTPPSALIPAVSPAMDEFIGRILAPNAEDRFATAGVAGHAFQEALAV